MKTIHLICAARPNFMKVAPLYHALVKTDWCTPEVIYTGQHYDAGMADVFLRDLQLPHSRALGSGSGTHAEQTASTMLAYERRCQEGRPDATVVVGDVNATMACALVCAKLLIPVVHLEAGLRSFDRGMPEEVNRVVTDSVSSLWLTPSEDADENLVREGVPKKRIHCIGNIMIDAFEMLRPKIEAIPPRAGPYAVVTFHRPSNVDNPKRFTSLLNKIREVSEELPVVFPVHPRAQKRIDELHWRSAALSLECCLPMNYVEFMALIMGATIAITDSGGVQEETSYLGIPCATVRKNTERPITVQLGTNRLVTPEQIVPAAREALAGKWKKGKPIPLWDGRTAERAIGVLKKFLEAA